MTHDGGYSPYDHGKTSLAVSDIRLDFERQEDFELLDEEDIFLTADSNEH